MGEQGKKGNYPPNKNCLRMRSAHETITMVVITIPHNL
jgi:hypothetical protein